MVQPDDAIKGQNQGNIEEDEKENAAIITMDGGNNVSLLLADVYVT